MQRRGLARIVVVFLVVSAALSLLHCNEPSQAVRIGQTGSAIEYIPPGEARKVCQLTGSVDRTAPSNPTAAARGSTSTVTGTDIGYGFEQGNHIRFLFGDSHEFSPDFCEPAWCGTQLNPKNVPMQPTSAELRVRRAPSEAAYAEFKLIAGDGAESSATAEFDADVANCPAIHFQSRPRGVVLRYGLGDEPLAQLLPPTRLLTPPVATNPQDRFVAILPQGLAVITSIGGLWIHPRSPYGFAAATQISAALPNVEHVRQVAPFGPFLVFIMDDGAIQALNVGGVATPVAAAGAVDVSARWITSNADTIFSIDWGGRVRAYSVHLPTGGQPTLVVGQERLLEPYGEVEIPVGARPEDRFVVGYHNQILVTSSSGVVFSHEIVDSGAGIAKARTVSGADDSTVAEPTVTIGADLEPDDGRESTLSRVKYVVADGSSIYSISPQAGAFAMTTLDGRPVGRKEGAESAISMGEDTFAFFTMRNPTTGCTLAEGCAHDEVCERPEGCWVPSPLLGCSVCSAGPQSCGFVPNGKPLPGGQTVVAMSTGADGVDYVSKSILSTRKFLWAMPERRHAEDVPGLPVLPSHEAILVWGAGREGNYGGEAEAWGHSAPYLAVTTPEQLRVQAGAVYRHPSSAGGLSMPLAIGGHLAAGRPEDKHVFATGTRILVVTDTGEVFSHPYMAGGNIGSPIRLAQFSCGLVGGRPEDRWVLYDREHLVVVTQSGQVFGHALSATSVENAFQYTSSMPVGVGAKQVIVVGGRLLAVYSDGTVVAYSIDHVTRRVGPQVSLTQSPFESTKVATRAEDRRVIGSGNRIYVIRDDGQVWFHAVSGSAVGIAQQLASAAPVGAREEDSNVLIAPSAITSCFTPNCADEVLVVTRPRWWFFAGMGQSGSPMWSTTESGATPLEPFGRPDADTLGYFSARYVESLGRYVMLYNRPDPRGVYFTTAPSPWGPWEEPVRIFNPANGYCDFMHDVRAGLGVGVCPSSGTNESEEGRRGAPEAQCGPSGMLCRAWGGEYAPFLLPGRYSVRQGATVPIYFQLSTWNPYQVILMRTDVVTGL